MEDTMLELLEVCRQKESYCMHNDVADLIESALNSKLLSINLRSQRLNKKKQEVKNIVEQPTKRGTQPKYSLSMGYENLSTTLEMESDEIIKSSVEKLVPIQSEYEDNSLPEFKTFSDHTKDTRSGNTTAHANNSLPERGRLFLALDNSIQSGIGNIDYDSEGDIQFLEELLRNDSIPLLKNKPSNFDHHDDPSFPRPPLEPPDVEFFFDFKPNSEELIAVVINNIDELIEDECFNP
nr:hypothetical protein [Tanacetum cinerariifolium]